MYERDEIHSTTGSWINLYNMSSVPAPHIRDTMRGNNNNINKGSAYNVNVDCKNCHNINIEGNCNTSSKRHTTEYRDCLSETRSTGCIQVILSRFDTISLQWFWILPIQQWYDISLEMLFLMTSNTTTHHRIFLKVTDRSQGSPFPHEIPTECKFQAIATKQRLPRDVLPCIH